MRVQRPAAPCRNYPKKGGRKRDSEPKLQVCHSENAQLHSFPSWGILKSTIKYFKVFLEILWQVTPDATMALPEVLLLVTVLSNHSIRKSLFKVGRKKNASLRSLNWCFQPLTDINEENKNPKISSENYPQSVRNWLTWSNAKSQWARKHVCISIYIRVCVYIWQAKDTNLFILVCALAVYTHRSGWQTQISCGFQPPSTTVLMAVHFHSISCNTWPTYESHEYIIPLFIYRDPKQKVGSSASSDAGAEGQQQHVVYHLRASACRLFWQRDQSHLAGATGQVTLPRSRMCLLWFFPACLFLSRCYFYQGNTAG